MSGAPEDRAETAAREAVIRASGRPEARPAPEPVNLVPVDDNYLIMTEAVIASYQLGLDLNYASWAMTSAVPSLLAEVRRLRAEAT